MTTILVVPAVDTLPEWSKGVESSSTLRGFKSHRCHMALGQLLTETHCSSRDLSSESPSWLRERPPEAQHSCHGILISTPSGLDPPSGRAYWISSPTPQPLGHSVFCRVFRIGLARTCITAYRCHIALAPIAGSKRFFFACCGKPLPMLPTANTVSWRRGLGPNSPP